MRSAVAAASASMVSLGSAKVLVNLRGTECALINASGAAMARTGPQCTSAYSDPAEYDRDSELSVSKLSEIRDP
jgi:hypothetical protein